MCDSGRPQSSYWINWMEINLKIFNMNLKCELIANLPTIIFNSSDRNKNWMSFGWCLSSLMFNGSAKPEQNSVIPHIHFHKMNEKKRLTQILVTPFDSRSIYDVFLKAAISSA